MSSKLSFSNLSYKAQRRVIIISFSLLPMILLITFSYYPLYRMVFFSFFNWNGFSANREFIGLDNYVKVFSTPEYFSVFRVSLYYFFATFLQMAIALYFATLLTFKVRAKNVFKGALFFPFLLNGVAIGFIFLFFFRPAGTLDSLLLLFGLESITQKWLLNPDINNISLAMTSVWRYVGFNFIIFLGAIQSIPSDIYEAAEIDGASRWQQFKHIILPSIRKIVELNIILSVSGAISVFEIPYIMTGGANGTKTFVIQTVETAFKFNKFGLASAMAVILLIIVILVTLLQKRLFGEKEDH
ncbi:sugar ABC transporter permease [Paenibacillus sp. F411]|uniref:carbohydrate ABC transporter permease n=1 Tax=Paenibacillus sp. F411 TaxID=2820239 RepID=UPI001AAFB811|nr:sugar ABC transporter permease [Paenibacillus sp. F411]MBO2946032.1 sugar ABC transporter permease [Paenibacillus sp. F411]